LQGNPASAHGSGEPLSLPTYLYPIPFIIQLPAPVNVPESFLAAKSGKKLFDVHGLICYNPTYCSFPIGKSRNSPPAKRSGGEESQALSALGLFLIGGGRCS
jgi:hypothetical protein